MDMYRLSGDIGLSSERSKVKKLAKEKLTRLDAASRLRVNVCGAARRFESWCLGDQQRISAILFEFKFPPV